MHPHQQDEMRKFSFHILFVYNIYCDAETICHQVDNTEQPKGMQRNKNISKL